MDDLMQMWLDAQTGRGLSDATIRRRRSSLRGWSRWCAEHGTTLLEATDEHVAAWLGTLPSQGTRHCYAADLRSFYSWAQRRHGAPTNPAADLGPVPEPHRQPRPLPVQRVAMALGMATPDTRLAILLGCLAGLRAAEIASLRGECVDLVDATIRVEGGKGGKTRTVPLHPALASELALRPQRGYLFPGRSGGHVTAATVGRRVAAALRKAGMDGAVGHQTRHSCATWLLRSGATIDVVAEIMGHSSVDTTRGYAALASGAPAKAVRRLRLVG